MYTISAYAQIWEMRSSECNIDRFALLNRASSSSIRGPDASKHEAKYVKLLGLAGCAVLSFLEEGVAQAESAF